MADYSPKNQQISFQPDSSFRNYDTATDTGWLAFDLVDGEFEITEPYRNREEHRTIGGGRNLTKIAELGYNNGEGDLSQRMQSGIMFYYALGSCSTVSDTPTGYQTHTITEGDSLPSFVMHIELEHATGAESIRRDLIGCVVNTFTMLIEKEAVAKATSSLIVAKSIAGSDVSKPADLTPEYYQWHQLKNASSTFLYNSTDVISNTANGCWDHIDKIEIVIENNLEAIKVMGDEWSKKLLVGKRDYSINMHVWPQVADLYNLINTKVSDYATDLSLTLVFERTAGGGDYLQIVFDKLYLKTYPNILQDWEAAKAVGLDIELGLAPGGSCAVTIVDSLGIAYYEGS